MLRHVRLQLVADPVVAGSWADGNLGRREHRLLGLLDRTTRSAVQHLQSCEHAQSAAHDLAPPRTANRRCSRGCIKRAYARPWWARHLRGNQGVCRQPRRGSVAGTMCRSYDTARRFHAHTTCKPMQQSKMPLKKAPTTPEAGRHGISRRHYRGPRRRPVFSVRRPPTTARAHPLNHAVPLVAQADPYTTRTQLDLISLTAPAAIAAGSRGARGA
jgi:hypothetical protein